MGKGKRKNKGEEDERNLYFEVTNKKENRSFIQVVREGKSVNKLVGPGKF